MWKRWAVAESYEDDVHENGQVSDAPFSLTDEHLRMLRYVYLGRKVNMANNLAPDVGVAGREQSPTRFCAMSREHQDAHQRVCGSPERKI
ncbi:unnamed protein product [Heligmosomoides polygyrus]|uniref:Integrase n=1 Tax=Heligmosomoides polygyrus TaxID=6339 RepID=A0A183GEE1_HELPZ|nr:unnamed protein product [Heligmosomoides polygyrus]